MLTSKQAVSTRFQSDYSVPFELRKMNHSSELTQIDQKIETTTKNTGVFVVTHLLPDRPEFIEKISRYAEIEAIIPKKKSLHSPTLEKIEQKYRFLHIERSHVKSVLLEHIRKCSKNNQKIVLLDIGGYFAPVVNEMTEILGEKLIGIVEDTENGIQKYEKIPNLPVPVVSVARSPLKLTEDYLVGQSIFFSAESILREINVLPNYLNIGVIGYGKIGQSVAAIARTKCTSVSVYDSSSIAQVNALARGHNTPSRDEILRNSQVLFCCTGNHAIKMDDLAHLRKGCYIISCTSKDDELALDELTQFPSVNINKHVTKYYTKNNKYFYLVHEGNAINFIHNAVVGNFIKLVQEEIIEGIKYLAKEKRKPGIHEISENARERIAREFITFRD